MEVLKSGDSPALVSNLEVMQILQERATARQSQGRNGDGSGEEVGARKSPFKHRDWIEETVLNHLQSSPVGATDVKSEDMPKLVERLRRDPGVIGGDPPNGDERLSGYGLTNAETLQILNHLPTSLVELHLLIEDIEKRKPLEDEEKQSEFLKLVSTFSGRQAEVGDDNERDDGGEGEYGDEEDDGEEDDGGGDDAGEEEYGEREEYEDT